MIPSSGSINVISSATPSQTALTGNVTIQTHITNHPYDVIVTVATSNNTIRTAPFVFLKGAPFSDGTRIVDTKSSLKYTVSGFVWNTGILTITHSALPIAVLAGQKFCITGASNVVLNGIFTADATGTTTTTTVVIANPGSVAGVTGFIQPGIIETDGDNRGYYTVNLPTITTNTAALTTPLWAVNTVPTNTTHVILVSTTNTNYVSQIVLDGVSGVVFAPANQILCLRNLQAGKYFRANNNGATDLIRIVYCSLNPLGNK